MDGYNADLESMNSVVSDMGSIMTDMNTIMTGRLKQVQHISFTTSTSIVLCVFCGTFRSHFMTVAGDGSINFEDSFDRAFSQLFIQAERRFWRPPQYAFLFFRFVFVLILRPFLHDSSVGRSEQLSRV
jgi:hypothetical protein